MAGISLAVTSGSGPRGSQGISAYDVAVNNGFVGTEAAWLASLIGPGVPAGGTTGQELVKTTDADFDTQWVTP